MGLKFLVGCWLEGGGGRMSKFLASGESPPSHLLKGGAGIPPPPLPPGAETLMDVVRHVIPYNKSAKSQECAVFLLVVRYT